MPLVPVTLLFTSLFNCHGNADAGNVGDVATGTEAMWMLTVLLRVSWGPMPADFRQEAVYTLD